ncbi:MAG: SRPBCC family protein [Acidimicrobiia bacterium]|nr:SRPBCC family protein [Acidimicrobiia bacterium]
MIRLTETASTTLPREVAFEHIGDFANVEKWDPGVVSAAKSTSGDVRVGTAYDLVISYGGREMAMTYVVTDYMPGRKIVLEGNGSRVKAVDVIDFIDEGTGTLVTYTADLSLKGLGRLVEPLLKARLSKVGTDAGEGMRRWLTELEVARN